MSSMLLHKAKRVSVWVFIITLLCRVHFLAASPSELHRLELRGDPRSSAPGPFTLSPLNTFGMLRLCSVITWLTAALSTPTLLATLFAERLSPALSRSKSALIAAATLAQLVGSKAN